MAKTYDGTGVSVDGTVTNAATGAVTITAIACSAGNANSSVVSSAYTLQVAQPTLQGPAPGVIAYSDNASAHEKDPARPARPTITEPRHWGLYTANATIGTAVSCTNGTQLMSSFTSDLLPAPLSIDLTAGNQTFWVVGCKPGYKASNVETATYTVTLNQPAFTPAAATFNGNQTVSVKDTANAGAAGEYVCVTTDGVTAPACGAPCAANNAKYVDGDAIVYSTGSNPVDHTGAILQGIACTGAAPSPTFGDSAAFATPAYVFQLDPPAPSAFMSGQPADSVGAAGA